MINAKIELLEHIKDREVEYVSIVYRGDSKGVPWVIKGELDDVLGKLNFTYDDEDYEMYLNGYIWYKDGSWSEREERDGAEWWVLRARPSHDIDIEG